MTQHVYAAAPFRGAVNEAGRLDAFLGSLSRRVVARATGTSLPSRTRLPDEAKQRLWLGMLASEPELIAEVEAGRRYKARVTPAAQGFAFRVTTLPAELEAEFSCAVYLALHPTLEEQRAAATAQRDQASPDSGDPDDPGQRPRSTPQTGGPPIHLTPVWTKIQVPPFRVRVPLPAQAGHAVREGEDELTAAIRSAVRVPPGASLYLPRRVSAPAGSLPRDHDLRDETAWRNYCRQNLMDPADVHPPEHRAAIQVEVLTQHDFYEILVVVVNTSPAAENQLFDGVHPYEAGVAETRLYEVQLAITSPEPARPYDLEQVAHSYRYRRDVPALGHACPVETRDHAGGGTTLRTQFAAEQPTWRVYPRESVTDRSGHEDRLDTSFDSLINDPLGTLTRLVRTLDDWIADNWSTAALDELQRERGWKTEARHEAEDDAQAARQEAAWVRAGLDTLAADQAALDAFIAANRAMKAAVSYDSWHPFQVAWIVGCIPGMTDPTAHPEVSIVWFPTAGGKTEAYLGLMLATLFYGRYTGAVTAGAQVWARFPLRLLALQQNERFARMVLHAELIRRQDPRISGGDPFGLGYFVGGGNTPNKLFRPDPNNVYHRGAPNPDNPEVAEACRVLERCPVCGSDEPLQVRFDDQSSTMLHICTNPACPMSGALPVWSVDDAVYRHAPSVLVGTVDKLALLAMNPEFQVLLGRAHSRCPRHGYTANPLYCAVFGCQQTRTAVRRGFGHVRLEIADELHLLDESLGALDGMYETLLQAISERVGNEPMQIVAATATIEGYQNQVVHLYRRDARRFPVNGPKAGETFWSVTRDGDPLRRYLGVQPRAGTMITATREIAVTHAGWVADLLSDPKSVASEAGLDVNDPAVVEDAERLGRDLYEVFVAYCLRIEDLSSFTRDERVRELLASQENLVIINSDATSGEIRAAVARLTHPPDDDAGRVKIIAATKAMGYGFDVPRLGVMSVMGTPTQAAEIIQASARVGRRFPGLVVNVINPTRDRDASVYRYYTGWIRYLDRLVHKVPVNRESLPVLKRVLSGGLMAWLLQVHDRRWITGARRRKSLANSVAFREAVQSGFIDRDALIDNLMTGFGIDPRRVYHQMHRDAITTWVDDNLAAIPLRAAADKRLSSLLHPPVPRSLRDVEEPIVIHGEI
jgi:hypothetical protein